MVSSSPVQTAGSILSSVLDGKKKSSSRLQDGISKQYKFVDLSLIFVKEGAGPAQLSCCCSLKGFVCILPLDDTVETHLFFHPASPKVFRKTKLRKWQDVFVSSIWETLFLKHEGKIQLKKLVNFSKYGVVA